MMKIQSFHAMGCSMLAALDSDAPEAASKLAGIAERFAAWEQQLSRFLPDSELNALNRRAGAWTPVSDTLWHVLRAALHAAEASAGLVTPTLLTALEAAGYDQSFEQVRAADRLATTHMSRPQPYAWRAIRLDAARRTVWLPHGMRLDLGGIAKGWAAEQAADWLSADGPALVDAGGDIVVSGPRADGSAWPIGIADPRQPGAQFGLLMIHSGGVATSGRDYRRWQRNARWQHHIIDPRTNRPAITDVLSASVIAPTLRQAEMAAKVVFILGSHAGLLWIEAQPTLAGLLVCEDGSIRRSRHLRHSLWSEEYNYV
ncbi:MAG TPA: FAD:protein FMN transferase [Roseiflexaceae bacterium]|nr:FAD:protein FMN transferase [Roseiflexaceae bacterium]